MKQVTYYQKFRCRIFAKLQKAFYIVDIEIFLEKLNHYDACSIKNKFFESYFTETKTAFCC